MTWILLASTLIFASPVLAQPGSFDHSLLDKGLDRYVDETGRVDYTGLKQNRADLDACVVSLSRVSPKSHLDRFPTREEQLAYWINTYNALTLKGVLEAYPVASVKVIKLLPGFFKRTWYTVGGKDYILNDIEHDSIRAEFGDPRIHAAINCASIGCPRLERQAFNSATLEARLDRAMREFLNEDRNVRIDTEEKTVTLSKILSWFEDDFTGWLKRQDDGASPDILDYARRYHPGAQANTALPSYAVAYFDYDWSLNDQAQIHGAVSGTR
ncbi:MAG: hypothetical protein CME26_12320 [Gemmatimonadetes bacterium]|nr:hypothetical protein [Gemmatimonadota bacterium]|tara:strand:+ start:11072 stop:11881 length:810 start_codon:yes stop_codon:yes gene_type:complete